MHDNLLVCIAPGDHVLYWGILQATTVLLQLVISERRRKNGLQQSSSMACMGETVSWSRWAIHTQNTTNVKDGIKTIVQGNLTVQRYFEQILRPVVVPFAQVPGENVEYQDNNAPPQQA